MTDPIFIVSNLYPELFRDDSALSESRLSVGWTLLVVRLLGELKMLLAQQGGGRHLTITRVYKKLASLQIQWELQDVARAGLDPGTRRVGSKRTECKVDELRAELLRRIARAELASHVTCQVCGQDVNLLRSRVWGESLCIDCERHWGVRVGRCKNGPAESGSDRAREFVIMTVVIGASYGDAVRLYDSDEGGYLLASLDRSLASLETGDRVACIVGVPPNPIVDSAVLIR